MLFKRVTQLTVISKKMARNTINTGNYLTKWQKIQTQKKHQTYTDIVFAKIEQLLLVTYEETQSSVRSTVSKAELSSNKTHTEQSPASEAIVMSYGTLRRQLSDKCIAITHYINKTQ